MGKPVLFLIRHGVRGIIPPSTLKKNEPNWLLLASDENLSRAGHNISFDLGSYISQNYKLPDFIYADNSTDRTIDTGINIGLGSGVKCIYLNNSNPDPFFPRSVPLSKSDISTMKSLIKNNDPLISTIKKEIQKIQSDLDLSSSTTVNDDGSISGLLNEEYLLASTTLFAEISKINFPLLKIRDTVGQAETLNWNVRVPTFSSVKDVAVATFEAISYFLSKYDLSVLVGHEENILYLAKFIGVNIEIPGYPENWVPPNSGFMFTLGKKNLEIQILYLDINGSFNLLNYTKIPIPTPTEPSSLNLISKTINY